MNEDRFMDVLIKAIGAMSDESTLIECIGEICEKQEIDYEEMAKWIKNYKSLFATIEKNAKDHKILKDNDTPFQTISIAEYF